MATTTSVEVERTYAAPAGWALPDLGGVVDGAVTGEARTYRLDATYLDTDDLRLHERRVRLRRRTGGADAGWHLKAPSTTGTTEVHAPAGRSARTVPAELRSLLLAVTRGRPLVPVARVRTTRTEADVRGPDGTLLALVADDDVTGQLLDPDGAAGELLRWREVEVELAPDVDAEAGARLLDAVEQRLLAAGATPAEHPSKAGRVLAARAASRPGGDAPTGDEAATGDVTGREQPRLRPRSPARDVVLAYLRAQIDALVTQDPRVRRDEEEGVHKMRVATRRLRSTLRTARPLLDRERTEPLRAELRWLAAVLGTMRDGEVQRARLLAAVDALPAEHVLGPVRARVDATTTRDLARARRSALKELSGERYLRLLDDLDALARRPSWRDGGERPARTALPPLLRRVHRRTLAALDAADAAPDAPELSTADGAAHRDEALHDARKLAKRLRYAAELAAPALGADAAELASRAEDLQEALGEHQDAVAAAGVLQRMGVAAHGAGENAYTFGLLAGLERGRAAAAEAEVPDLRRRLEKGPARRLLRR